jgi:hypothetical protein
MAAAAKPSTRRVPKSKECFRPRSQLTRQIGFIMDGRAEGPPFLHNFLYKDADRHQSPYAITIRRDGQTLLSEPMIIYGFCKPRTESLEKNGLHF